MTQGFVKIHRKILDNEVLMGDAVLLKVFLWCVLKASWQDTAAVRRGQFCMGYVTAADELRIAKTTLREKLHTLKDAACIELESDHSKTIVTICNYGAYQDRAEEVRPQSDRDPTAKGQPSLLDKEGIEFKNPRRAGKNTATTLRIAPVNPGLNDPTPEQIADEFARIYCGPVRLEKILTHDELAAYFAGLGRKHGASTVFSAVQDVARDPTDTPLNFDTWFKARRSPSKPKADAEAERSRRYAEAQRRVQGGSA